MRLIAVALVCCLAASLAVPPANAQTPPTAVESARAKVVAGDLAGAVADLARYVPAHPADAAAGRLLGDLYFRIPDYRDAENVWRAIVTRTPEDRETHNRLGSLYAAEDRLNDAIAEFEMSLPSRIGFAGLVAEHRRAGDLASFEARYRRDADEHPFNVAALEFYGNVLRAENAFVGAQPYFTRVAFLRPNSCTALVDAGNNLIDLGKIPLALGYLGDCLKIEPGNYDALVDAGEAYTEIGGDAQAGPYFARALAVRPTGAEVLVDLGFVADDGGKWQEALAYYQRAIVADPLQLPAYTDLGYDYNEHKLYRLAEAAYIKGITVAPEDGVLHYMLAVTYNEQGKIALARAQLRIALGSSEDRIKKAAQAELALLPPG